MRFSLPFILAMALGTAGLAESALAHAPPHAAGTQAADLERTSVTRHSVTINGHRIDYQATAGTVVIDDAKNQPQAQVFYIAYTKVGAKPSQRPVTFLYNGGPGAASFWLAMGSIGPKRVLTDSPNPTGPAPYRLIDNPQSLLDKTDLVFIDAVGTGYSKPLGKATGKDFWGVDQDVSAFARAINRYVTINHRWNSPKFLFGESYGTTRSAALVDALQEGGMTMNGVVLMSSILNYAIRMPGYDEIYVGYLPSYAAAAWYHHKLANRPADLGSYVNEVRAWANGPYAAALSQGQNLPQAQFDQIAQQLAAYTGLSVDFVKRANLRIDLNRFRKELLRDESRTLGRFDSRFEGIDEDDAGESPEYDASDTGISGAFTSIFHQYLSDELKYTSPDEYVTGSNDAIRQWDWQHRAPGSRRPLQTAYVAGDLAHAIRVNPSLHVLSLNGYYDFATPFSITEYDISHMNLAPALRGNVQFRYFPSGHMIYLNTAVLPQLKQDLSDFYDLAAPAHDHKD
ncbi:S10 family peptidase [Frateuria aurantia]